MKIKNILFIILSITVLTNSFIFSQTEQQVANELQKQGITTQQDVQSALKSKNMSEDDARGLAKQYGIDYDSFIKTYITGGKALPPPPPTQKVDESKKTDEKKPEEKKEEKKEEKPVQVTPPGGGGLAYFGYNIFNTMPGAFEPAEVGFVDPGYLIGPGDALRLYVWGAVELQYELKVDNQGTIFIPTAGQFFVSGIQYKDLQTKLTRYLSKFYEGLATQPPTIFLDVTIAKLRPIKIFVLGEVAKPGAYNISSFATVFNALYSFGGPLTSGSLREIRVIRNKKVLTTVDLYDYILNGKLIGDARLQDNDIIFIPPRKKTISISGEVLRPAIYELKPGENLQKILQLAGGLNTTAYSGRIQIARIKPFNERKKFQLERELIDVDLNKIISNVSADFNLSDGDLITIFPISDAIKNYVTISGSVMRPGNFEISKVPRLINLISEADGLLPDVYFGKADIIRTKPDLSYEFITINLADAIDGDTLNNVRLKPLDQIKIYSIYELVDRKNVSISGYVKQAVTLPFADSLTLYDMVFRAGGLQDPFFRGKAFLLRADLIRVNPDGLTTRIIPFDLEKLLREKTINMDLKPGDKIYIYKGDVDKVLDKYVTVEGEVKSPGQYPLNTNMTIMDIILQAGGFTEAALRTNAYISRLKPGGYSGEKLSQIYSVPLSADFTKNLSEIGDNADTVTTNFKLEHKDIVVLRVNPNYQPQRIVTLKGEVKYPGTYVLKNKRQSLLDLLKEAGGPTSEAFLFGTIFTRGGKRLIANVEKLYNDNDEDENILLNNGDDIFVPKEPNTVFIAGEINNPGLYKHLDGYNVKDYIDNAGGTTDSANYVIYRQANGNSKKVGFGLFSSNPKVYDGSFIEVTKVPPPEPSEKVDVGGTIKDVLGILVSAITIIVLARQIK